jgi:hypothetical protein
LLSHRRASVANWNDLELSKSEFAAPNRPANFLLHHERRCAIADKGLLVPGTMTGLLKEKITHALQIHEREAVTFL